jgi:hypothetical protein
VPSGNSARKAPKAARMTGRERSRLPIVQNLK